VFIAIPISSKRKGVITDENRISETVYILNVD